MTNMITVAPGFQYSINIGYDLWNDDKLSRFIPTKSAFKLLEEILLSTNPSSSDRARVLIGAYGKGKSHIVLMILSILMKRELKLFEKMMPKIRENPRLNQLVQNYYGSNNMILPVVIAGSSTSLTQAFLFSLQRTLSEHNLLDVMPETNYRAAINVIKRWEKEFPETYSKFTDAVNQPVQLLIHRLEEYDFAAYQTFERVYPSLTAGSVFNPFLGFDVVELYESVAKGLKAKGYTGIYVVYDEFSKYLETNIIDATQPEKAEELKQCLELFHDYVRGGLEIMFEQFTDGCTTSDDYLNKTYEIMTMFKKELEGLSYSDELVKLIR